MVPATYNQEMLMIRILIAAVFAAMFVIVRADNVQGTVKEETSPPSAYDCGMTLESSSAGEALKLTLAAEQAKRLVSVRQGVSFQVRGAIEGEFHEIFSKNKETVERASQIRRFENGDTEFTLGDKTYLVFSPVVTEEVRPHIFGYLITESDGSATLIVQRASRLQLCDVMRLLDKFKFKVGKFLKNGA